MAMVSRGADTSLGNVAAVPHRAVEAPTPMHAALAELKRDPSALAPLDVGAFGLALRLVEPRDVDDAALIERLGAWRAAYMANYPTQFEVTAEGTAAWLRDLVLGDADRLMFLIVDADDPF